MKTRILGRVLAVGLLMVTAGEVPTHAATVEGRRSHDRGALISLQPVGTMNRAELQRIAAEFPGDIGVGGGARLFRITYWTAFRGRPIRASALLSVPLPASPAKGVMLYLHGTNTTRALAPSQPGRVDGNEETAVFAGNGFIVALPDYIGLGTARIPHPYLIVRPAVDDAVDLLRAIRRATANLGIAWSPNLFMMGFSQGGQVVAGLHRELERRPLPGYRLRASIGIAGPYDLRRTSLPKAIETNCRLCVGYLTWAVYAYATYYGHPLGEAIKPAFAGTVPTMFDGSRTAAEIGGALPDDPADMFQPQFLAAMRTGGDNWFTTALSSNETYAWAPVAPMRLYFGEDDVDVPPAASRAFFDFATRRGGNISLHPLAHADHQTSASLTYAPALRWFNELAMGR